MSLDCTVTCSGTYTFSARNPIAAKPKESSMAQRRFLVKLAIAYMALVFLPLVGAAQPLLPHTLHIDTEKGMGISVSYPDDWSVAQPTMNTWVIRNVPADQQETVAATVQVQIGSFERTDYADAV